jgi:hypothetical protein
LIIFFKRWPTSFLYYISGKTTLLNLPENIIFMNSYRALLPFPWEHDTLEFFHETRHFCIVPKRGICVSLYRSKKLL